MCLRTRADEVHVSVGCADTALVSGQDEAGAVPGGGAREQQCGRTQGKGARPSPYFMASIPDVKLALMLLVPEGV